MTFTFPADVPVLTDGRVTLRAHRDSDLDLVYAMTRDPQTRQWTGIPLDNTREDSRRFITDIMKEGWEHRGYRGWAIEAVDDDGIAKFAGNLDLRGLPISEIGWALHPWARGRGIMQAAVTLATNWAFTEGSVEIIHWRAHVGNIASVHTAIASGFTLHGITPGILYERGQVLDAWTGALRFGDGPTPKHASMSVDRIEGARVRLRPFIDADVPRIVEACTDPVSRHWLSTLPSPYTDATARAYMCATQWDAALSRSITWAVADKDTDELVANISVMGLAVGDPTAGEIGYWAHRDARGKGVTTEALQLVAEHALAPRPDGGLGLRRLSLYAGLGNAASNAVAHHAGFVEVGCEHASEPLGDGTYDDVRVYELLAHP